MMSCWSAMAILTGRKLTDTELSVIRVMSLVHSALHLETHR